MGRASVGVGFEGPVRGMVLWGETWRNAGGWGEGPRRGFEFPSDKLEVGCGGTLSTGVYGALCGGGGLRGRSGGLAWRPMEVGESVLGIRAGTAWGGGLWL